MNARLNGQLVRVELEVQKMSEYQAAMLLQRAHLASLDDPTLDQKLQVEGDEPPDHPKFDQRRLRHSPQAFKCNSAATRHNP